MKKLIVLITVMSLNACIEKNRSLHIFIPENYVGKVGIYFGVDSSTNHMISSKDDMYMIFLNGRHLESFNVKEKNYPGGPYTINYYYYSKDTLYQLNSSTVTKSEVDTTFWVKDPSASGRNGSIQTFEIEKVR